MLGEIKRLYRASFHTAAGIKAAFHHEKAVRNELIWMIILVPAAFFIAESASELILLIGSVFLVLIAELLNSSMEAAFDKITTDYDELIKRGKDYGSAAVFFAMMTVVVTWGAVLLY